MPSSVCVHSPRPILLPPCFLAAMMSVLPLTLLSLLAASALQPLPSSSLSRSFPAKAGLLLVLQHATQSHAVTLDKRANQLQTSANGSSFIWSIQDIYQGSTFFECVQPPPASWRPLMEVTRIVRSTSLPAKTPPSTFAVVVVWGTLG